jgi:SAM-dependent methyltransferase
MAPIRARQVSSGEDLSVKHILIPTMRRLMPAGSHSNMLDVGCGTGIVTATLGTGIPKVVGIDISAESIAIARRRFGRQPNLEFECKSVEAYARSLPQGSFSLIVANMTLMTCPSLRSAVRAIGRLLADDGALVFTITHPWFWPLYWGYASSSWFKYDSEMFIEAPFAISLDARGRRTTTHVHRPLHRYVAELAGAGFNRLELHEPMPNPRVSKLYPERWQFPRFLAIRCSKE